MNMEEFAVKEAIAIGDGPGRDTTMIDLAHQRSIALVKSLEALNNASKAEEFDKIEKLSKKAAVARRDAVSALMIMEQETLSFVGHQWNGYGEVGRMGGTNLEQKTFQRD